MKVVPDSQARETSSFTHQGAVEAYIDFIDHLLEATESQIDNDRAAKALLCQLAYENANKDCRTIIGPLGATTRDISKFVKACQDVGTQQHQASLLAAAIKGDPRCYNYGKSSHLSKDIHPHGKGEKVMTSFPSRTVRAVARADIGQRNATLILTKTANLFRETSKGAPAPAAPTLIGAFRTAIKSGNADKCTVSDLHAATRGSAGLVLVTTNRLI